MMNDLAIAARFRQIREELKMTQKAFAVALNNTQANVSNYENGVRSVSSEILATMMSKFSVNPVWILSGSPSNRFLNKKDLEKGEGGLEVTVALGVLDIHTEQLESLTTRVTRLEVALKIEDFNNDTGIN